MKVRGQLTTLTPAQCLLCSSQLSHRPPASRRATFGDLSSATSGNQPRRNSRDDSWDGGTRHSRSSTRHGGFALAYHSNWLPNQLGVKPAEQAVHSQSSGTSSSNAPGFVHPTNIQTGFIPTVVGDVAPAERPTLWRLRSSRLLAIYRLPCRTAAVGTDTLAQ